MVMLVDASTLMTTSAKRIPILRPAALLMMFLPSPRPIRGDDTTVTGMGTNVKDHSENFISLFRLLIEASEMDPRRACAKDPELVV